MRYAIQYHNILPFLLVQLNVYYFCSTSSLRMRDRLTPGIFNFWRSLTHLEMGGG